MNPKLALAPCLLSAMVPTIVRDQIERWREGTPPPARAVSAINGRYGMQRVMLILAALMFPPFGGGLGAETQTTNPGVTLFAGGFGHSLENDEVALHQALLDVTNPFRLLCVAAHPDDEDGATLAYYRMKHGVSTNALIATHGEGGQNEIGPELYEELGVIRTFEMIEAAKVEGAALHFLNLPEFGYSKTAEETFEIWGKETTLSRLVYVIRRLRPHVIITNHGRMKDHGHHQALGRATMEAFDLAADREFLPHVIEPWRPSRLFIRTWETGEDSVTIDISELEPARGKTYAQIAADALREHKSQGMQFFIDRYLTGEPKAYYDLVKGVPMPAAGGTDLFAGLPLPEKWDEALAAQWRVLAKDRHAPDFRQQAKRLPLPEQRPRLNKFPSVLGAYLYETSVSARLDDDVVTPGQTISVEVTATDKGGRDFLRADLVVDLHQFGPDAAGVASFEQQESVTQTFVRTIFDDAPQDLPRTKHLFHRFFPRQRLDVIAQFIPPRYAKVPPHFRAQFLALPIAVAPEVFVQPDNGPVLILAGTETPVDVPLRLTNYTPGAFDAEIRLDPPEGWGGAVSMPLSFTREDEQKTVSMPLMPPPGTSPGRYAASVSASGPEKTFYETAVPTRVVNLSLSPDIHVGVVQSYDDTFVNTLAKLGVPHATLGEGDFKRRRLDRFTTIIIDIRAYLDRQDLIANNQALLNYVKRGGTLLVMYQKTFEWKPEYAPFPITLSRNRVTLEDAPITVLAPEHPLFSVPNAIVPEDWDGWIQERGLYFPSAWAEEYTPLIACNDPGESIPPGSCLVARHGKGVYLYTALGWYRQIRELHPGALRVFANMLAL